MGLFVKVIFEIVWYNFEKSDCGEVRFMVLEVPKGKKLTLFRRDSPTKTLYTLPRPSVARPRRKIFQVFCDIARTP